MSLYKFVCIFYNYTCTFEYSVELQTNETMCDTQVNSPATELPHELPCNPHDVCALYDNIDVQMACV